MSNYRTRSLRGSLLVSKGLNDCVTIERDESAQPRIVKIEGDWDAEELREAAEHWRGSEASRR